MKEENFDWEPETESRKLQLFTDRHKFTRLFAEYLNDDMEMVGTVSHYY